MDEKHKLFGNFEKINFKKILKFFDENSIEKLNFFIFIFLFFRKFVTKNRYFRNNTIFLQQFFRFRGRGISPFPLATLLAYPGPQLCTMTFKISIYEENFFHFLWLLTTRNWILLQSLKETKISYNLLEILLKCERLS